MEKERRIKKEVSRLKKLYNGLDSDTMEIAKKLIERAAFMAVELEDLEVYLAENGWAGEFRQSDQGSRLQSGSSGGSDLQHAERQLPKNHEATERLVAQQV